MAFEESASEFQFEGNLSCWNESMLSLMHGSPEIRNLINVVDGIICAFGLCGNLLVVSAIWRFPSMRTVTNVFILMLAMADITFLLNIPFLTTTAVLEHWPFGDLFCKVYYFMTTVSQFASSFFLAVLSADRFLAVCQPIRARKIRTTQNAGLLSGSVWTFAIVLMYPVFLYAKTDPSNPHCNIHWPDYDHAFTLYSFFLGFAVPVFLVLTLYGMVIHSLWRRHRNQRKSEYTSSVTASKTTSRRKKLRRVTLMIFTLTVVFLVCWSPYWITQLNIVFSPSDSYDTALTCPPTLDAVQESQTVVHTALVLQCLCFAHSALNPVLYGAFSKSFRNCYASTFHVCWRRPATAVAKVAMRKLSRPSALNQIEEIQLVQETPLSPEEESMQAGERAF